MKRWLRLHTLRGRVRFLSLLLITLPVLASVLVFGLFLKGRAERHEREHQQRVLEQYAAGVDSWLERGMADMLYLANSEEARNLDLPRLGRTLEAFAATHRDYSSLLFADATGRAVLDDSAGAPHVNLADRPYFQAARLGRPYASDILFSRISGRPVLVFSAPVLGPDGAFQGLVLATADAVILDAMARMAAPEQEREIYLVNRAGEFLTGRAEAGAETALPRPLDAVQEQLLDQGETPPVYVNRRGATVAGVALTLKDGQWLAVAETPLTLVHAPLRTYLALAALAGIAVIALLSPALLRLTRSIEEPLEEMARLANGMRDGEPPTACAVVEFNDSPEEIRTLYETFCRMTGALQETITRLAVSAITDPLTGLANRRSLLDEGRRQAVFSRRMGTPFAVLMIDLDRFKRVNDSLGHQAGDQVLRHVAALLRRTARGSDMVARYGGEEFVILAPGADTAQALRLAERVRAAVEAEPCALENQTLLCSVSVGVAALDGRGTPDEALDAALGRADQALYQAKAAGRNRVASA